jgi:hypothetical protein
VNGRGGVAAGAGANRGAIGDQLQVRGAAAGAGVGVGQGDRRQTRREERGGGLLASEAGDWGEYFNESCWKEY